MGYMIVIHCGVVGNIQASHVCAPGSIPGDGAFFFMGNKNRSEVEKDMVGSSIESGVAQW